MYGKQKTPTVMGFCLKAKILITLALCSLWASVDCVAEQSFRPLLDCATFDSTMATLAQNRKTYNKLNDSIFIKRDKDEWIQNFRHRSDVFTKIYNDDHEIIDALKYDVEHYALADSVYYHNEATLANLAQLKSVYILQMMINFVVQGNDDPFLVKEIAKPICDLMIRKMPESEVSLMADYLMANCYHQILRFNQSAQLEQEFIHYCKHGISFEYRMPTLSAPHLKNFVMGCYTKLVNRKSKTMGKVLLKAHYRLEALLASEQMKPFFDEQKKTKKLFETLNDAATFSLLRNYYMAYAWNEHTPLTDSIAMHDVTVRLAQNNKLTTLANKIVAEVYLGTKTFDQAFAEGNAYYADRLTPKHPISVMELSSYTNPILNLIFLADSTTMTFEQKHAHMLRYTDALVASVRSCKDNQSNNVRNSIVIHILGYHRLLKYLTSEEKENLFHSLLVYTQVQTYAHSKQVSDLCVEITNAIIDKRPELLVGMLGTRNKGDVKKNRQKFLKLMAEAGLFHDLGKLSMAELVKNDYRPMTDDEFAIIKMHPERGATYLKCDSALMQYHDFVIGHHKWYNGKGGYPRDYDNTKSPYRTLVDVLTICDCLDAATDRVGRNYAHKKSYIDLVNEFQAQSGTRYNPDIVEILTTDKKLTNILSSIIEGGWISNYYEIFKDYFNE